MSQLERLRTGGIEKGVFNFKKCSCDGKSFLGFYYLFMCVHAHKCSTCRGLKGESYHLQIDLGVAVNCWIWVLRAKFAMSTLNC